ncbi:MAG: hypothetical protein L6R28_04945 [Planctomycetes bacterium]|nr:hypothetical protein [Planctomycetota bacterium]
MADKPPSKRFDKEPSASSSSATLEANDDPVPAKRPGSTRTSVRSDAKASGRTSARTSARGPAAGGGGGNAVTRMAARRAARRKRQEEEAARLAAEAARPLSASELVQRMSQESAKKKQEREDAKIREEEEAIEKAEREAEEKAAAEEAAEKAKRKAEEQEAKKAELEARKAEREARKVEEGEGNEEIEEAKPRWKIHWSLKIVAFLMLVFLGYLGFLWATTGHVPALHTEEGRDELVRDVKEDWATLTAFSKVSARDLDKYLQGKPPETKEQIAALVDESKQDLAAATEPAVQEHPAAPAPKADASHVDVGTLRKAPTQKKISPYGNSSSNTTTASRSSTSSRSSSNRGVKVADPRLATARDLYQKAIALYVQADPRSANASAVQKYLREAKPLFEKVLDECDKAAAKGVNNGELDRLQRDAAMRLYDCNKRTTL